MKMPTFLLFSALSLCAFAEEEMITTDELAANDSVAMQKIGKAFGRLSPTERVENLEAQIKDVYTDTVRGHFGAKAASARAQIDSYRLYTQWDVIVWKQYEGGDDYAFTELDGTGTNKHTTFDWACGFKGAIGYHFPHDSWDALARYTWYQAHASSQVGAPAGGNIEPLTTSYIEPNVASHAKAKWTTKMSVLDVEIGKSYFLSGDFSLNPFFGLRTAWINQKMHDTFSDSPDDGLTTLVRNRNDFWGIGPWSGLNTTFFFSSMFNMFGSFAGTLMISSIDVHARQIDDGVPGIDLNANVTRVTPAAQASLGLGWEMNFNRNRNHVAVKIAYETQYWWRQNQTLHYGIVGPAPMRRYSEDLGIHGINIDLLFDF